MNEYELSDKCKKANHRIVLDYDSRIMLKKRNLNPENYYWCNHPRRMECKYHNDILNQRKVGLCDKNYS